MTLPHEWVPCKDGHAEILHTGTSCPLCECLDDLEETSNELAQANQSADHYWEKYEDLTDTAKEFQEKCVCGQLANERII
jgi:hypothetical protein